MVYACVTLDGGRATAHSVLQDITVQRASLVTAVAMVCAREVVTCLPVERAFAMLGGVAPPAMNAYQATLDQLARMQKM